MASKSVVHTTDKLATIRLSSYHKELLLVQDICDRIDRPFAGEMMLLCRAYRRMYAAMSGLVDPITEDLEPVIGDHDTPAAWLLGLALPKENYMKHQTDGRTTNLQDFGRFVVNTGSPPAPPPGIKTRKGPSVDELLSIVDGQWIKIKPDEMKFSSLKARISQANKKGSIKADHRRLICWEQQDGHMIVRREV